ncbi:MAG: DUF5683 domain-containing protein, partial [candidate division Zixibacteria bacterium]|nr:DUF5683 domain-containing protein [candidate division Zixibacteria bacterium]
LFLILTPVVYPDSTSTDSLMQPDTTIFQQQQILNGFATATDTTNYERRLIQNPTAALFKSLLVPGLGQIGNRSYFKAVLFAGLEVWMVSAAIHYGRQASDFRNKWSGINLAEDSTLLSLRNTYYDLYEDRKDESNKCTWFAVIVAFVSMFDAYVDAHLSGFPRKEEESSLGFQMIPQSDGGFVASLSLSF